MSNQKVSIGRTVNYVVAEGEIRPMTIVKVWDNECVNGVQFRDGTNDDKHDGCITHGQTQLWRTSVSYDAGGKVGTWHWPVVSAAAAKPAAKKTAATPAKKSAAKKAATKTTAKKKR